MAAEVVLVMLVPFIELSTAEKHKSAKKATFNFVEKYVEKDIHSLFKCLFV